MLLVVLFGNQYILFFNLIFEIMNTFHFFNFIYIVLVTNTF